MVIDLSEFADRRIHENFRLSTPTRSPGRALNGREQILAGENAVWIARWNLTRIKGAARLRLLAMADDMRGRFGSIRLSVCNRGTLTASDGVAALWASLNISQAEISDGFTRYSDDTTFTDGTGFALPQGGEPKVSATTPAGATRLTLTGAIGLQLSVGSFFSHDDFLYRVAENDNGQIRFNPPLRQAISAGAEVQVSNPTFRGRLTDDDGFALFEEYYRRLQPVELVLVEDWTR